MAAQLMMSSAVDVPYTIYMYVEDITLLVGIKILWHFLNCVVVQGEKSVSSLIKH